MLSHIFLYNDLKIGRKHHQILRLYDPIRVGMARVDEYALWSIANTLPAAVKQRDKFIYGELWVVSPACLIRLDQFEYVVNGAFERELVKVTPLKTLFRDKTPILAEMYVWQQGTEGRGSKIIDDGVWL